MNTINECADVIEQAVHERSAIGRLTERFPDLTIEDGYAIQDEVTRRRLSRGEKIVGAKLGLTSKAKQVQMKVYEPLYGRLFSGGVHLSGEPVQVDSLIHPRVEPEIVFIMDKCLAGPGVTPGDVVAAVRYVCCGLEVIDSRYADFSFTAADVVADNTSEAKVVYGPVFRSPDSLDLALTGLLLETDGDIVATATGAATMGHPAEAVALLANWLGQRGRTIEAGWAIFTGGLTAAVPLKPGGYVSASFGHLGTVTVRGV